MARLLMDETRARAVEAIDNAFGSGAHLVVPSLTAMLIREVLVKFGLSLRVIACRAAISTNRGDQLVAEDKDHLVLVGDGLYFAPLLGRIAPGKTNDGKIPFAAGRFPSAHQSDAPFRVRSGDVHITFDPKEDQISWLYSPDLDPKRISPLVKKVIETIAA